MLVFASGSSLAVPFESSVCLEAPDAPRAVASGDFNADGTIDLAVTSQGTGEVAVWYGSVDGQHGDRFSIPMDRSIRGIVAADFNGDTRSDLAVSHITSDGYITVHLATVESPFAPPVTYPGAGYVLVAGDFNNDSHTDIVGAKQGALSYTHLGRGDGTFLSAVGGEALPSFALGLAAADLDSDGNLDLAVPANDPPTVQLFRGDGTGAFTRFSTVDFTKPVRELVLTDFNSDRLPDLAAALGNDSGSVAVCLGTETGFSPPVHYLHSFHWRGMASGDLDGDGYPDIASTALRGQVGILRNKGNGHFEPELTAHVGEPALDLAMADLNRDSLLDLAVTSISSDTLTLLYNTLQRRGSALAGVQTTQISSPGDWFQELVFNYNTFETLVHPPHSGQASVPAPTPYGQWNGIYHYDYTTGAFTQARYSTRQLLVSTGGS